MRVVVVMIKGFGEGLRVFWLVSAFGNKRGRIRIFLLWLLTAQNVKEVKAKIKSGLIMATVTDKMLNKTISVNEEEEPTYNKINIGSFFFSCSFIVDKGTGENSFSAL